MQHRVLSRIAVPDDIDFLYQAMTADDQYLYSTKLKFGSIQAFEQWLVCRLRGDFHDFYIVTDAKTKQKVGYVHNYDFSLRDGHCKLVVYICPAFRKTGVGAVAAVHFVARLFERYPLRKLYSTIYDYNRESLKSNLAAGFAEEGVLRDYRYYDGTAHSIHYLSLSRDAFETRMKKWVK